MHRHVPFDPALTHLENLELLYQQVQADAEHMQVLKDGIERVHERVEAQAATLDDYGRRFGELAARNLQAVKDHAELRGTLAQRAVRLESSTE